MLELVASSPRPRPQAWPGCLSRITDVCRLHAAHRTGAGPQVSSPLDPRLSQGSQSMSSVCPAPDSTPLPSCLQDCPLVTRSSAHSRGSGNILMMKGCRSRCISSLNFQGAAAENTLSECSAWAGRKQSRCREARESTGEIRGGFFSVQ